MKRMALLLALAALLMVALSAPALAADPFPQSTNEYNQANDLPHVDLVKSNPNKVWLEFVNPTEWLFYFEYRVDGQVLESGKPHQYLPDDYEYPGVNLDGRYGAKLPVTKTVKFKVDQQVEVRLALGAENDYYFDWTAFEVKSKR